MYNIIISRLKKILIVTFLVHKFGSKIISSKCQLKIILTLIWELGIESESKMDKNKIFEYFKYLFF